MELAAIWAGNVSDLTWFLCEMFLCVIYFVEDKRG